MKADQIRGIANQIWDKVDWLDRHATVRRSNDAEQLDYTIADIQKLLLKLMGAPAREPRVEARPDVQTPG